MPKFTRKSREARTKQKLACTLTIYAFPLVLIDSTTTPRLKAFLTWLFSTFSFLLTLLRRSSPYMTSSRMRHSLLLTSFDMGPTSTPATTCPRPMALTQARHVLLVKARKQNSRNLELNSNRCLSPDFQTHLFPERKKKFSKLPNQS